MYEFFGKKGRLILCFCIKCTITPRPNPYSGVPAVRVFFLEVLATFKLLPTGLTQPRTLGLFCGPSRPTPSPFLLCEKKWEKKAHQGIPPGPFPPSLLTQKTGRRHLLPLLKCGCPHSKSVFYFHGPQASCKAMERGTLFFVRPMPPKGGGGIPAGAHLLFAGSNG